MPKIPRNYKEFVALLDTADGARRFFNFWPPFRFAGIHIDEVSHDWRRIQVTLRKHRLTSNYVGTQYGGSLYSMCDPFWMVMLIHNLGDDWVVWDKKGEIEFVSPGKTAVTAVFELTDEHLAEIRAEAAANGKALYWFGTDLLGTDGTLVARVRKQVYARPAGPRDTPPRNSVGA